MTLLIYKNKLMWIFIYPLVLRFIRKYFNKFKSYLLYIIIFIILLVESRTFNLQWKLKIN